MLISILSLILSAAAFFFTVLIYRRRRTFENENHFFIYKLQQYGEIISGASGLMELFHANLHDLFHEITEGANLNVMDEISDEIEDKMTGFRILLHRSGAFIPQHINDALDGLYENILEVQEYFAEEKPKKVDIENAIESIDPITEELEKIINLMRIDTGIDSIDTRLKRRAK
jgi:hypothetical protein